MAGSVDMFLAITGKKQGQLKGEAAAAGHEGEIQVLAWSFGAAQKIDATTQQNTGRRSWTDLTFTKHVDRATALLYSSLITNEQLKAVLVVRTVAEKPVDTLKVTIDAARVHSVSTGCGGGTSMTETVTLAFGKIEIEYNPQGKDRSKGGAVTCQDDLGSQA